MVNLSVDRMYRLVQFVLSVVRYLADQTVTEEEVRRETARNKQRDRDFLGLDGESVNALPVLVF